MLMAVASRCRLDHDDLAEWHPFQCFHPMWLPLFCCLLIPIQQDSFFLLFSKTTWKTLKLILQFWTSKSMKPEFDEISTGMEWAFLQTSSAYHPVGLIWLAWFIIIFGTLQSWPSCPTVMFFQMAPFLLEQIDQIIQSHHFSTLICGNENQWHQKIHCQFNYKRVMRNNIGINKEYTLLRVMLKRYSS